jgi:hypothetical protein
MGSETNYYLKISIPGSSSAAIAYEDLVEVVKAFEILKQQAQEDALTMKDQQIRVKLFKFS